MWALWDFAWIFPTFSDLEQELNKCTVNPQGSGFAFPTRQPPRGNTLPQDLLCAVGYR